MKAILSLTLASLLLFSCTPKFYTPNVQNVPMIQKQGDGNVTLSGSASRAEFQGAYGITNHLAVQANAGFFFPKSLATGDGGSGQFVEGGFGYFKPIAQSFIFETYGLVGIGSVNNRFPSSTGSEPGTNGTLDANILRYGVQPSISLKMKHFSLGLSSRIAMLNYSNISGNFVYASENQQQYLYDNRSNFLLEPALTFRAGLEHLKFQLQFIRSYNFSNPRFKQDFNSVTIGLNYGF